MRNNFLYIIAFVLLLVSCVQKPEIKPQRKDMVEAVFASGKAVTANEYKITAFAEGYLVASMVVEGDSVKKGQPLFRLLNDVQQTQVQNALVNYQFAQNNLSDNAPQIVQLQQQIRQAMIKKQTDSVNVVRYQNLITTNAVAKADYDKVLLDYQNDLTSINVLQKSLADLRHNLALNVANTKAQYEIQLQNNQFYLLSSVSGGLILTVYKKNGDLVKKGETVADVGSGKMIARLYVAEDDIQRVQLHQTVLISLNTDKNRIYKAVVSKIYPSFDETSQAFIVEAVFSEMPAVLKEGTQLQANCIISEKKQALVIPSAFLLNGDSVMIKAGHRKIAVKTGIKTLEWIEITGGLTDTDVLESAKDK